MNPQDNPFQQIFNQLNNQIQKQITPPEPEIIPKEFEGIGCVMCGKQAFKFAEENGEPLCKKCYQNNKEARRVI